MVLIWTDKDKMTLYFVATQLEMSEWDETDTK